MTHPSPRPSRAARAAGPLLAAPLLAFAAFFAVAPAPAAAGSVCASGGAVNIEVCATTNDEATCVQQEVGFSYRSICASGDGISIVNCPTPSGPCFLTQVPLRLDPGCTPLGYGLELCVDADSPGKPCAYVTDGTQFVGACTDLLAPRETCIIIEGNPYAQGGCAPPS